MPDLTVVIQERLRPLVRIFLSRDAVFVVVIPVVVSLVLFFNMYGANPQFHAVWEHTPQAIPTLSFVESVIDQHPVRVPSNHMTWFGVWVLHHVVTTPKWIVMALYGIAAMMSAFAAYALFRSQDVSAPLATVGALLFGLLPARFAIPILAHHWWVVMPVVMWWAFMWWGGHYMALNQLQRRGWFFVVVSILLLSLFGYTLWWWSAIVLVICAVMAGITHYTVRPVVLALIMTCVSWFLLNVMHQLWPIPPIDGDAGIRLSSLWVPHPDHLVALFAQRGSDFRALDLVHTDAMYIGFMALIGVGMLVWQSLVRSAGIGSATVFHRLLLVVGVIVIIANQRGLTVLGQFVGLPSISSMFVDLWIAFIGIIALVMLFHSRLVRWWLIAGMFVVMLCDHIPHTNIMYQMIQQPQNVPVTHSWQQGIWFGQRAQASDVVSITGVGAVEPGYGRWSDAARADYVEIVLAEPIAQSVTLEIRARGVGVNIGAPVVVQIGDEQQTMVLTGAVDSYFVSFIRAQGDTIRIYPQPVSVPPPGDTRRIGVLLQSIRVVAQ
ncbi:MAG: DUF7024 domain-containing protein [Chloroflexota bacterium]|jgi:hypothetical protein